MIMVINWRGEEVISLPITEMTLFEAETDKSLIITGLYVEDSMARRLQALGLNEGTRIKVKQRKKKGALIVQVRGTKLALGKHITAGIKVKEDSSNG